MFNSINIYQNVSQEVKVTSVLESLALIFLVGLSLAEICRKIKLPRIIGILSTGIILGPYVLNLLDPKFLAISSELRRMALIIILLKAGFSLNFKDIKKVGRPAIFLSFIPASFEIIAYVCFAPLLLNVNIIEAAIIGTIIAAVSPAVVVPRMINFIEKGYGSKKGIPQMIMAGASSDDIFVIVLFTAFLEMGKGKEINALQFLNVPISIILGISIGIFIGFFLFLFFELSHIKKHDVQNRVKIVIILGFAFLLAAIEDWSKNAVAISSLLAIVAMGFMINNKSPKKISNALSDKLSKMWIAAELILFVMVGADVKFDSLGKAGGFAILMIFIGLFVRSIGVLISLIKTGLNRKEKLFCVISYLPKATVQAAIGSIPLQQKLPNGELFLAIAVLAIIITAPLGSILIDLTYKKLLLKEEYYIPIS